MPHSLTAPVQKQERIQFIDALRGFALFGILLMNIMSQGRIWLRYYCFGPFKWLWRSVTFWKKQPMKMHAVKKEVQQTTQIPAIA